MDEGGSEEGTASELAKGGGAVAILAGKREDGEEKRGGGKDEGESGGEPRRVEPHLGCPLFFYIFAPRLNFRSRTDRR